MACIPVLGRLFRAGLEGVFAFTAIARLWLFRSRDLTRAATTPARISIRSRRRFCSLVGIVLLFGPAISHPRDTAAQRNSHLPTITRIAQIRQLSVEEANRGYPVKIRAVVTFYRPALQQSPTDLIAPDLFVQDATAGIWINAPSTILKP